MERRAAVEGSAKQSISASSPSLRYGQNKHHSHILFKAEPGNSKMLKISFKYKYFPSIASSFLALLLHHCSMSWSACC